MNEIPVFTCTMCGQCCEGKGGIVLGPYDLERISRGLDMSAESFLEAYGEKRGGKWQVRVGDDNNCVFFRQGKGCTVHPIRPNVCRAWPFFRGNLVDPESFLLAREYCPGIRRDATFGEFVKQGMEYLEKHRLVASDPQREGHALLPPSSTTTSF